MGPPVAVCCFLGRKGVYLEEGVVGSKGYQVRMLEGVADTEARRSRDRRALRGLSVASMQARTEWTLVSWPAFSSLPSCPRPSCCL